MVDVVSLPPSLDVATVSEIVPLLLEQAQGGDIRIDAQSTDHIDAFGAQVLLSAHLTARASNSRFTILHLQEDARDQLIFMGLADLTQTEDDT